MMHIFIFEWLGIAYAAFKIPSFGTDSTLDLFCFLTDLFLR